MLRQFSYVLGICCMIVIVLSGCSSQSTLAPVATITPTATATPLPQPHLLWFRTAEVLRTGIQVTPQALYYATDSDILAVSTKDGQTVLWKQANVNPATGLFLDGTTLYCLDQGYHLNAFDANTGMKLHSIMTSYQTRGMSITNGIVYVNLGNDHVLAYQASDGKQLWDTKLNPSPDYLSYGVIIGDLAPLVRDGIAYVSYIDGKLYALNATSGAVQWTVPTLPQTDFTDHLVLHSGIAIAQGIAFFTSEYVNNADIPQDSLFAVRLSDHAIVWKQPFYTDGYTDPVVVGGTVYIAGRSSVDSTIAQGVFAFDAVTGQPKGTFPGGRDFVTQFAVTDKNVLIIEQTDVQAYTLSGGIRWSVPLRHQLRPLNYAVPIFANGVLYAEVIVTDMPSIGIFAVSPP